jgi:multiple sugar transport system permease protein
VIYSRSRFLPKFVAGAAVGVWLLPFAWMLWGAFISAQGFRDAALAHLEFGFENFRLALQLKDWAGAAASTVIVALLTSAIVFAIAIPAAHALVKWSGRSGNLFLFLLSTRFLPPAASMVAFVILFQALNLMNTWTALILVGVATQLGFFCVLLTVNMSPYDPSFEHWLLTQGARSKRALAIAVWERSKRPIVLFALLCFVFQWNEFLYAATISGGGGAQTLPVVISGFITGQDIQWGPMFAGCIITILPAFFLAWFIERNLIRSFTVGLLS